MKTKTPPTDFQHTELYIKQMIIRTKQKSPVFRGLIYQERVLVLGL